MIGGLSPASSKFNMAMRNLRFVNGSILHNLPTPHFSSVKFIRSGETVPFRSEATVQICQKWGWTDSLPFVPA